MAALFEACRAIPAHEAAQREGLSLQRRGARLWTSCPLHGEKTPSLCFFPDGGWHCFGCGQGGDAVAFYAALHGLPPVEAAQQLAADFGLSEGVSEPRTPSPVQAERDALEAFDAWWRWACAVVADSLRMLDTWKHTLAPVSPSDPLDARYCEALQALDYWEYLFTEYLLGGGARMDWDGTRWQRDDQHAFEMKARFYKRYRKEVEALDAIRAGSAACA